jgi:hypothetical protein
MLNCLDTMPLILLNTYTLIKDLQIVKPKTKRRVFYIANTSFIYFLKLSHAFNILSAEGLLFNSLDTSI